jgi:GT2 family glycosyltransferase
MDWDVLVVDNASTDDTARITDEAISLHLPGRGRRVRELQPGVMFARRRATLEARGELIAFLDDDNIPAPDYVENAIAIMARHPEAGIAGGKVLAHWLGTPTPLGEAVAPFALAIRDRGEVPFAYPDITGGPDTAGMVARLGLLRTIFSDEQLAHKITGRKGKSLISGEDTAIVIRAHQLGFDCRYEPQLVIHHRLPASRSSREYLLRLYEGIGRGQAAMRPLLDAKAQNPLLALLIASKDGGRWLVRSLRGPPPTLRKERGALADDFHRLCQAQVWGRFVQGLREPFR